MPGGNGTGPLGMGPLTGRRAGFCAGNTVPGFNSTGFGRGMGRGVGGGRGIRRGSMPFWSGYANMTATNGEGYDEKADLQSQEELLETQLKQVKSRLKQFSEDK